MTQTIEPSQLRIQNWVSRVEALAEQVAQWSQSQGWRVEREDRTVEEERVGTYHVPALRIFLKRSELLLEAKALDVPGTEGRVDLWAYPAMSRVMLLSENGVWKIMTESHIALRQSWNKKTFLEIVPEMSRL